MQTRGETKTAPNTAAPDATTSVPTRKRILVSAFACSPQLGSEPGVGWRWVVELARHHDVTLITHRYFKDHVQPVLQSAAPRGLSVIYVQAPTFGTRPERYLNSRLYYTWWQWWIRSMVASLVKRQPFDVIHHLTWGTMRFPSFLGGLGVPFVMGPLGGAETAPLRLMRSLPWKARLFETVRTLTLRFAKFDPLAMWGPLRSTFVLCRTSETLRALPRVIQARAALAGDVGAPALDDTGAARRDAASPVLRTLYAGRLIPCKGIPLAFGAIARLRDLGIDLTLDIAGRGPLRGFFEAESRRLGIQDRVRFLGHLPREDVMSLYREADLFLFPSLHDSGGSVVLESLSRGLPVICLDLGGPKHYIDDTCGKVVATAGLDEAGVEQALADAVRELHLDRRRLQALRAGALQQARRFSWAAQVDTAYWHIGRALGWQTGARPSNA